MSSTLAWFLSNLRRVITRARPLLLGSASPRRRELLERLGLPLVIAPPDVDEDVLPGERPDAYLQRIVVDKLAAASSGPPAAACGAVLVADTSVLLGDEVLGKPRDDADAAAMIRSLAGRAHEVWTRFAVAAPGRLDSAQAATVKTRVVFRALDDAEIRAYVATGEGRDKAGAYAIQGVGSFAVERVEGSYSNVVGLPVCEVVLALRRTGLLGAFPLASGDA